MRYVQKCPKIGATNRHKWRERTAPLRNPEFQCIKPGFITCRLALQTKDLPRNSSAAQAVGSRGSFTLSFQHLCYAWPAIYHARCQKSRALPIGSLWSGCRRKWHLGQDWSQGTQSLVIRISTGWTHLENGGSWLWPSCHSSENRCRSILHCPKFYMSNMATQQNLDQRSVPIWTMSQTRSHPWIRKLSSLWNWSQKFPQTLALDMNL